MESEGACSGRRVPREKAWLPLPALPAPTPLWSRSFDSVASVVPYEGATILLFEQNQPRIAYVRGFPAASLLPLKTALIPTENSHFREVLETKQPYLVVDTQQDPNWFMVAGSEWIRASIEQPIIIQDQVVGLIAIDSSAPGRFDANDMARVELFARYAALAVSNAYQSDVLAQLVYARTAELKPAQSGAGRTGGFTAQRTAHRSCRQLGVRSGHAAVNLVRGTLSHQRLRSCAGRAWCGGNCRHFTAQTSANG